MRTHRGNAGYQHRVIALSQFEIVVLRARPTAQRGEVEPDHPVSAPAGRDHSPQHLDLATDLAFAAIDGRKIFGHAGFGRGIRRVVVDLHLFQRSQAVIHAGIDFQHVQPAFHQGDGRQEAIALQTVRIEAVWRIVRGHDEDDASGKQRFQQTSKNHGIGDVGDMELIKTEQADIAGNAFCQCFHRLRLVLQFVELAMHLMHEGMEVDATLALVGHRVVETIHQKALAAPDATPEIDPARRFCTRKQSAEGVATRNLEGQQLGIETLQTVGSSPLSGVCGIGAFGKDGGVGIEHAARRNIEISVRHIVLCYR